jgi:group I intron endonuclease
MIGIYKITNPKGKIYIGQSMNINKRKYAYKSADKRVIGPKISNSLNKYGWENHKFEIIEECNIDQLYEKEVYWKEVILNEKQGDLTQVLFCNMHDVGSFGPLSQHIIDKLKGQKRTIETKLKMRNAKIGKPSNFQGKKHTDETKKIQSNKKLGKPSNNPKKVIIQYDLEGEFIKKWDSITSIKKSGLSKYGIHLCCQGKQKSSQGSIWKWGE